MPGASGHRDRTTGLTRRTVAGTALTGWVLGVPALFLRWGGWPLDGAPGRGVLEALPLPAMVDQTIAASASILLWGLWGQLAWSVGAELVAWFRFRDPGGAPQRRTRVTDRRLHDHGDTIRRFAALLVHAVLPRARPHPRRARGDSPSVDTAPRRRRARRRLERATKKPPAPAPVPEPEPEPEPAADGAQPEPAATTDAPVAAHRPEPEPVTDGPKRNGDRDGDGDEQPERVVRLAELLATRVDVLVRVLGPVEALRPGVGRTGGRARVVPVRQKALEALVYLALSDAGVTRHELGQVLFPDGESSERALYNAVHQVQQAVGHHAPPEMAGRHLLLPERITTDYDLLGDLHAQAGRCADRRLRATLLDEALSLVRGEPFSGVTRSYAWAAPRRREMADDVAALATELAELYRAAGDDEGAADAARRGLAAAPDDPGLRSLTGMDADGARHEAGV